MDRPTGKWRCRACGQICDGADVYIDPRWQRYYCADLFCGGTVDRVETEERDEQRRLDWARSKGNQ